jgi:cytochrome c oxidase cbb3-type subunit III
MWARGRIEFRLLAGAALAIALTGCAREERNFRASPAAVRTRSIAQSDLHPGDSRPPPQRANPYEGNAEAVAQGRKLYVHMNCIGCHFNGGGGIGPPLMDDKWIYGSEPANIFATIIEGRPDGMPSYGGKLNDQQVWQLVAYVRSLGSLRDSGKPPTRQHRPTGREKSEGQAEKEKLRQSQPGG